MFKMEFKSKLIAAAAVGFSIVAQAQSPVSGFMTPAGKVSVSLSYSSENYDNVFLVPKKVEGVPIFKKVENTAYNLYVTYGSSDKINLIFSLPYITSKGNADQVVLNDLGLENERKGIQDGSLFIKFKPFSKKMGNATLDLLGTVGITAPLGGYNANEGFQSIIAIGNASTKVTTLGIAQLKMDNGLFATAQLGYSIRNNRVPNAFVSELKLGYAGSKIYVDAYAAIQQSGTGNDILQPGFDAFFPATRVNYGRLGVNVYVPIASGFGVSGGFNTYISGRNLGQSTGFSAGLVKNF